jgi:hypothetical protein
MRRDTWACMLRGILTGIGVLGLVPTTTADIGDDPPPTSVPNLTGTWEGKATCEGFLAGEKDKYTCCEELLITQTGADLNLLTGGFLYNGVVLPDADKPETQGEAAFIRCGTDDDLGGVDEMGRATKVSVNLDNGKGTFTATSFSKGSADEIYTCKWSYKRVNTADPGVPECSTLPPP